MRRLLKILACFVCFYGSNSFASSLTEDVKLTIAAMQAHYQVISDDPGLKKTIAAAQDISRKQTSDAIIYTMQHGNQTLILKCFLGEDMDGVCVRTRTTTYANAQGRTTTFTTTTPTDAENESMYLALAERYKQLHSRGEF